MNRSRGDKQLDVCPTSRLQGSTGGDKPGGESHIQDSGRRSLYRVALDQQMATPCGGETMDRLVSQRQDQPLFLCNRAPGMRMHRP